ncbi:MAG: hypothetical protein PHQ41_04415 [Candidatus Cloacimonetes bacterium]|nr:hypothetical protein [Candidatus Cloacimonadota bacterium]
MGLGDLLSGMFGTNDGEKAVADLAVNSENVTAAAEHAASKMTGKPVDTKKKRKDKGFLDNIFTLLMNPGPVGQSEVALDIANDVYESNGTIANQIADDILNVVKGQAAELQMEQILGINIDSSMPYTDRLTEQIGVVTNMNAGIAASAIIAEIASLGQVDQIGGEARSYMDYSGLSQITGFGYGMILSSALQQPVQQEINQKISVTLLDPQTLTLCYFRGIIDEGTYFYEMGKHGYSAENVVRLTEATKFYPSGGDFITFAVRDVFNPEVVASGGLDDSFPEDIVEFAEKAGMPEDILRWYWRAHWQLPSPQMGYEMLHRGLITEDDLRSLLRAADWAPGWIENLMAISYNPLTRVDARRMWETGVLDDEGYKQAMMDIGYNEQNAELYLAWAKTEKPAAEKDLSQTVVLKAYNTGLMTRGTVLEYIMRFGYDAEEAELIVALEDQKISEEVLENEIGLLQWQYSRAEIVEETFLRKMEELGIPRAEATRYLSKAESDKIKRAKLPSLESLKRWYKGELITLEETKDYLTRLGYRAKERDLYIEEWKL